MRVREVVSVCWLRCALGCRYTYLITCTLNSVLCSILAGFYLTFKGYCLLQQGQLVLVAAKLVIRSATSGGALVGSYLAKGEAGDTCCPICQVSG